MARKYSNTAVDTQLSASITSGTTSISVASVTGFPVTFPYTLVLDENTVNEELVEVTAAAGTTLTVVRGVDGTSAVAHSNGASVKHTISARDLFEPQVHIDATVAHGVTGAVVGTDNTQTLTNKTLTSPTINNPTITGGTFDTPIGRRNVIRNGDMGVAQRGDGPFTAAGYTVDGVLNAFSGGGLSTSRVAAAVGSDMGQNGAAWALQAVVSGQSVAGDYAYLILPVESVRTLAGKEVTLSFLARAASGTPKIGIEVEQKFGTGGSPSAAVQTAVSAVTISTTATRYTVTFTIPSIGGKTLGTNGDDTLQLNLWLSAGSTNAARASNIGIQNATIDITDVQLEQGSGSPFERLSQAEQLAWCQRYFYRYEWSGGPSSQSGLVITPTVAYISIPFGVQMRAAPSLLVPSGSLVLTNLSSQHGTGPFGWALTSSTRQAAQITVSATGMSANQPVWIGGSGSLDFSAEL